MAYKCYSKNMHNPLLVCCAYVPRQKPTRASAFITVQLDQATCKGSRKAKRWHKRRIPGHCCGVEAKQDANGWCAQTSWWMFRFHVRNLISPLPAWHTHAIAISSFRVSAPGAEQNLSMHSWLLSDGSRSRTPWWLPFGAQSMRLSGLLVCPSVRFPRNMPSASVCRCSVPTNEWKTTCAQRTKCIVACASRTGHGAWTGGCKRIQFSSKWWCLCNDLWWPFLCAVLLSVVLGFALAFIHRPVFANPSAISIVSHCLQRLKADAMKLHFVMLVCFFASFHPLSPIVSSLNATAAMGTNWMSLFCLPLHKTSCGTGCETSVLLPVCCWSAISSFAFRPNVLFLQDSCAETQSTKHAVLCFTLECKPTNGLVAKTLKLVEKK